jgi:flagellar M-ring protein FliF
VQNLLSLWAALDNRRRIIVLGATVAMFVAVLSLARMAGTPNLVLLYAGLDSAAAGEVVAALETRDVDFAIEGDAIMVDAARRDELRMQLAADGLPETNGVGYELLDGLSGFGTTSQMFDAAYWRAKEGELARTILASPQIRAARVHVAQAPSQPFAMDQVPTASVTVTTANGSLSTAQAAAIRHLVAAAVSGLKPDDVAVIDSIGGVIPSVRDGDNPATSGDQRAAELKRNVERLLAARVGPDKAVVEVSVEVVTEREAVTERVFDPQGRVAISSETETTSDSATGGTGDVTVASNLPQNDGAAGGGDQSQSSGSKERVNYEVSETQRDILRLPGAVKKLSVAVLVDDQTVVAADGTVTREPRTAEELAVLRDLVASAVGLDEARGDVLTLRSLAFQPVAEAGTLAEASLMPELATLDVMGLVQMAVLALVALVLGLFVLRPILTGGAPALPAPAPTLALPAAAPAETGEALTGEIDDLGFPQMNMNLSFDDDTPEEDTQDPVARLRKLIEERQAESVEILRSWMELDEENA